MALIVALIVALASISPLASALCDAGDQTALLSIKTAFKNPRSLSSWVPATDCCAWRGVDCDATTGRVNSLTISEDKDIAGPIPVAIGDLPILNVLQLFKLPGLTGTIPASVAKLARLSLLDLSHNSLSGPIPLFLSNMTSLKFISLSTNQFSGPVPASLSNLPSLLAIHLDRNSLTGPIPDSFGNNFPVVFPPDLYLSNNDLSGPIPASLGRPQWDIIDLSRNRLTGDASVLFGASKPGTQILLSRNLLRFDLTMAAFPANLTALDLSRNAIYGRIPAQVNQLGRLRLFNVSYNQLCGEIPAGVVTAKFDRYSYVQNKCLCGPPLAACG